MTATADPTTLEIGKARTRKEDARLITGRTKYTDSITPHGTLHLSVVRSPLAHATITGIDKSAAEAAPGVIGVYTAADLGVEAVGLPCAWPITPDQKAPQRPLLASKTVHFAGEGVAVVVARTVAEARDAADLVEIDYDPLEPVLDMEAAIAPGATLVHPELETNESATWVFDAGAAGTGGSVDEAIAAAEADPDSIVLKRRFIQQRLIPAFMEPRSAVCDPSGEQITLWAATQVPHILRTMTTVTLGVPESKLRVIAPDVGGGFGGKIGVLPEEMLTVVLAQKLGKPIKWTETRSESLLAAHHGRDQIQDITITAKKDGTVTGLDVHLLADMGAYLGLVGPGVPILGAFMFNAIYKFPAYKFTCTNVFTTKTLTDAYRGAGRPEATFAVERIMDELAVELGRDPMELRQQNWIKHEEFPFTTVVGLTYDTGNYEQATDQAMEMFDYAGLRREQEERRKNNDPVQLGIGISTFTEMCGLAPSRVLGSLAYGAGGWEAASIRMLATGKVEVITGASAHGQGHETAFSQIVADQLGVPFEDVEILHGDTQISPKGLDTYGSRSLAVGGIAIVKAAEKVIAKAKKLAAHLLEASEDDIEFSGGNFTVRGTDKGKAIQELAFAAFMAHDYPEDMEPSLDSDAVYDPENFSYPHGTHLAAIEIDTETGHVNLRKYVCVDDIGNVVNPLIVEGQVHGGLAQGIAQALFEEANYDDQGTLVNGTFVDYTLPSAADLPSFDTATVPNPAAATSNPLGVKGVGEAGTIASTPAIVNGVIDALRHLGVTNVEMPCTSQRVWRAIQDAKGNATQETPIDTHSPGAGLGSIDPNNPQGETE
ncbi:MULTISPECIES: xanthine dehydrogenase family protein molybdopterin-binding subunit [unclassified Pseudonocardia]|jgi:carbon-monoxide dehydrogenase large subunit|uniref:xanthine dehydrogenase family protein molybdopterin-binding subunit n=1 Tax=unclassified Pseudonocardia TaxID=2619320 RepID=UPI0009671CF8|nr:MULTISPECIES: xanthine dehydrogenase family protein molybdopterin-binding subunit [unclassified Pseudonocardia]MBN9100408.1 xanthine dehydrogenase family protein molybdopterin-binding subunit [Pseudonocardia sp.]OJY37492.1 MAG: carbon monoxide dehydrogenase [Pseudonocardia sp. 73-21]